MSEFRTYTDNLLAQELNSSLYEYIDTCISMFDTKLEKAIAIYIKIAYLLWYNPKYIINHNLNEIDNLYDISVDNNKVICLHWAIIYSKLLDRYDIPNEIKGDDEHLFVRLDVDNFKITADATRHGIEYREYMLSDLTNTKLNFKITNFSTYSSSKNEELNKIIDSVYSKLGINYYDSHKVDSLVDKFRYFSYKRLKRKKEDGVIQIDKKEIDRRIAFINCFYSKLKHLYEVEKLQIFSKYYKNVFEGFDYETCRCLTMFEDNDLKSDLLKLIVVSDNLGNVYYYLETEYGFAEYEKTELINLFIERNIYFRYDRFGILGFNNEELKKLIK